MKARQVRDLSAAELSVKLEELKKQLYGLQIKRRMKQLDKPSGIRFIRRDIARMTTILKEKK